MRLDAENDGHTQINSSTNEAIQSYSKDNTMTQTGTTQTGSKQTADKNAIRPFPHVNVPEAELTELRRRINATKWPERETVTDATQGVQLATTQALARYWGTEYHLNTHTCGRLLRSTLKRLPC